MTPLNSYFLQGSPSEQRLIQDLINEQLSIYGQDVVYMPRKIINEKKIIKEIIVSKFDDSFRLEAYISTFDGFGGNSDILSKFGVRSTDQITFIISKERYEDFITPKLSLFGKETIKVAKRPQEGDLIYLPLDNALFEIKYVESKTPFYQLNNLYVYELRCELFEYEDEIIDTGLDDVDKNVKDFGYIATLEMVGAAASAASLTVGLATALYPNISGKSVARIDILNGGSNYKSPPSVTFSKPGGFGVRAEGISVLDRGSISKILITNPGIGYTTPPTITIKSNSSFGSGGIATAIIENGVLAPVIINSGGVGYSSVPTVKFSGPVDPNSPFPLSGINSATAEVVLTSTGIVTSVRFTNAGSNYHLSPANPPTIQIDSPIGISTGDYEFNEVVRGVSTGTSAYVKSWNYDTRILKVSVLNGNFALGETVVGAAASYKVLSVTTDNLYDKYADNINIEQQAENIIDFSEKNPFGEF
jgi:hypothetical protein